jgi:hypothetical protein
MVICFRIGSVEHCYYIPVVVYPVGPHFPGPGPGPVNYPYLVYDGSVLASVNAAVANISDAGVRSALQGGLDAALLALKKRAGDHVSRISFEGTAGGPPTGGGAHGPGRE